MLNSLSVRSDNKINKAMLGVTIFFVLYYFQAASPDGATNAGNRKLVVMYWVRRKVLGEGHRKAQKS